MGLKESFNCRQVKAEFQRLGKQLCLPSPLSVWSRAEGEEEGGRGFNIDAIKEWLVHER